MLAITNLEDMSVIETYNKADGEKGPDEMFSLSFLSGELKYIPSSDAVSIPVVA